MPPSDRGKYLRSSSLEAPDPTDSFRCTHGHAHPDLLPLSGFTRHDLALRFCGDLVSTMASGVAVCQLWRHSRLRHHCESPMQAAVPHKPNPLSSFRPLSHVETRPERAFPSIGKEASPWRLTYHLEKRS